MSPVVDKIWLWGQLSPKLSTECSVDN